MTIGDYFINWNSDIISISAVLVLVLMLSGYFYGRIIQKYIPVLKNIDCTVFGVLFIFAIFQMEIIWAVYSHASTQISYILLIVIIVISPILCLITWSNVVPSWKHLASLLIGCLITAALCYSSSKMTTMNIYSDTITYLSQTIESMKSDYFGRIVYVNGLVWDNLDLLHDFSGYYYFWAMLLKLVRELPLFTYNGLYAPLYIWGGTMLFGMTLGSLAVSCVNTLFTDEKWQWKGLILTLAALSPFYTNYWNTTLGFFGNTIRTISIGAAMLIVFLILKNIRKSFGLFLLLIPVYTSGICFSSSSFFIEAFITLGLFFSLCFMGVKNWKTWIGFILSCIPIFRYALIILFFMISSENYWLMTLILYGVIAVLCLIAWLIRNHFVIFDKAGTILFPILLVGLILYSFLGKTTFDMSYYFVSRSENDMTVNMTSHTSTLELIRNIVFYLLCILCFVNFKTNKRFKMLLIILGLLILNPLVEPAISTFFTGEAYSRSFDLLTNPFTIAFLIYNFDLLLTSIPLNLAVSAAFTIAAVWFFAIPNITSVPTKAMEPPEEGYDWKLKITKDSEDIYKYTQNIISDPDRRPGVLSQDVGLKGYVTDIYSSFTSAQYRDTLAGKNPEPLANTLVRLMYPENRFADDTSDLFEEQLDYSKLIDVFRRFADDYIIISNTMAIWDERGWYVQSYQKAIDSGLVTLVYQNDSWAILKLNENWEPQKKSSDRYWVHMY